MAATITAATAMPSFATATVTFTTKAEAGVASNAQALTVYNAFCKHIVKKCHDNTAGNKYTHAELDNFYFSALIRIANSGASEKTDWSNFTEDLPTKGATTGQSFNFKDAIFDKTKPTLGTKTTRRNMTITLRQLVAYNADEIFRAARTAKYNFKGARKAGVGSEHAYCCFDAISHVTTPMSNPERAAADAYTRVTLGRVADAKPERVIWNYEATQGTTVLTSPSRQVGY